MHDPRTAPSIPAEAAVRPLREVTEKHCAVLLDEPSRIATAHGLAVIAGGYEGSIAALPHNTIVAVSSEGELRGRYR
ncbi:hypothetical protein OG226_01375 [Streptomyces sp. NBC_01261]|uniref:hypothetical protein n=1 Tax=Streptomyces sp. NBC_01261 TaxID=2903802 RepID=UPI002E2FC9DB|nr:hypothetical protein [Streptomyces sp. NBC_01261]